jgi:hypothetical protein
MGYRKTRTLEQILRLIEAFLERRWEWVTDGAAPKSQTQNNKIGKYTDNK